ncbi:Protein of unknown function [Gryllus bimaculatus]|nr:Protein of unknown function [Gryllus bimaculatus]
MAATHPHPRGDGAARPRRGARPRRRASTRTSTPPPRPPPPSSAPPRPPPTRTTTRRGSARIHGFAVSPPRTVASTFGWYLPSPAPHV